VRRKLLLLLAAIAALLMFLAVSREGTPRTGADPTTSVESPDLASESPLERAEPPRPGDGPVAPAHAPAAKAKAASAPSDVLHLHGTVVVSDANDRQYPRESGRFTVMLWSSQATASVYPVVVEEGSWSLDVTETSRFEAMSVQSFELGKRAAIAATGPEERLRIPGHGRLDLHVRWPPRLTLHVQDFTGAELRAVLYFEPEPEAATDLAHPGILASPKVYGLHGSSTVYLNGPAEGRRWMYVGGPGYAWQRIEVLAAEYERTVTLERGGDLEVTMEAFERETSTQLRLFSRANGKEVPLAEIEPGLRNPCLIEGLPLGLLEVRAHIGDPRSPDLFGSVETEILAGQTSAVTVYLNPR
jgi:hypothetical protein